MILRILARIFLGKEVEESFDVKDAKAVLHTDDGTVFTVTRKGSIYIEYDQPWETTGREHLERYLSDSKRQILVADDGMVPVCKIKKIEFEESDRIETVKYRKGGLL